MPYLTNLATIARRTGFPVVEVPGWTSRGHGPQPLVQGVVCHHTAGRADMHVVRDGRSDLPGPLSQFWLEHTGRIFVVAAGRCWHNAPSTSVFHTNSASLGIEAENNGREPWPDVQLDAYRKLCAELCKAFSLPAARVKGHKEVNTAKSDPHSLNMNDFRAAVAQLMKGTPAQPDLGVPNFTRTFKVTKPMLHGADIRAWQTEARRFVPGLAADGWYGAVSEHACEQIQRIVGIPVTGDVDAETLLLTFIYDPEEGNS